MKRFLIIIAICFSQTLVAQESLVFKANYSIGIPLSQTSYLKNASYRGFGLGFGKIFATNFSLSLEASWNHFYQYEPRTTYYFEGGAITTDLYKYRQQVPVILNMNYFFFREMRLKLYAGLGVGINYIQDKILFNAYEFGDEHFGFNLQPKVGTAFALDGNERLHLFAACAYNFSTNKSETFEYKSSSSMLIEIGTYFLINQ